VIAAKEETKMSRSPSDRAPTVSSRFYRFLLRAYPLEFRQSYGAEMLQVFCDLALREGRDRPPAARMKFWIRILFDLVVTVFRERNHTMQKRSSLTSVIGVVLLIPTTVFLSIMFSKFALGIDYFYHAYDSFYMNPELSAVNFVLERFIVLAPGIAFLLGIVPILEVKLDREAGTVVGTVRLKPALANILIVGWSLSFIAIITIYGFMENFQPV
jgi:hypothetical protein